MALQKSLTVDDLIRLAVTITICFGILVVLILLMAFSLKNPELATSFIGEFSVGKGVGIGGFLLFFYFVLKMVMKKKNKDGK